MDIREEHLDDVLAIDALHREAFGVERGGLVAALVLDLRSAARKDDGLSLVAEIEGAVVGHVMFSRGLLDAPPRLLDVQILSPVAVIPANQRRGIAADMIRRGLDRLTRSSVPAVFLEGDPGYYSRLGFAPAGPLGFRKPSLRIPDAAFQVKILPAYEPWMTGTLVYPDPFWRNDAVGLRDHE